MAYMPKPKSSATRLVVHTAGSRIIVMSISGDADRCSTGDPEDAEHDRGGEQAEARPDVQPHVAPSLTPTSSATSQPDNRTAASTLIRPGVRTGDSGTKSAPRLAASEHDDHAGSRTASGSRGVDDRPGEHDARARRRRPAARRSADRTGTFSSGNSSRMIPNASGRTPPPMPWMTRATIITPIYVANAAIRDADGQGGRARDEHPLLADHVAERPRIGVDTDAESR